MKTTRVETRPFRLRQEDQAVLDKVQKKLRCEPPEAMHQTVKMGAIAILEGWGSRLVAAERDARLLEGFSRRVLRDLALSEGEAVLIACALRSAVGVADQLGEAATERLRGDIFDGLRSLTGAGYPKCNREELRGRVCEFRPGELVALLAAVARYWALVDRDQENAAVASGLVAARV